MTDDALDGLRLLLAQIESMAKMQGIYFTEIGPISNVNGKWIADVHFEVSQIKTYTLEVQDGKIGHGAKFQLPK